MVFRKPFMVAIVAVASPVVVVGGLLLLQKLCTVAGPSPSVTSAPDRVFS